MTTTLLRHHAATAALLVPALALTVACDGASKRVVSGGSGGPTVQERLESGRLIFRGDSLGNEGYWSDTLGLGRGLAAEKFSVLDALEVGLQVDADRVPIPTLQALVSELGTDLSAANTPTLRDHGTFLELLEAGAVQGLVAHDVDGDDRIDLLGADTLGVSCALCHSMADGFAYDGTVAGGATAALVGSIGARVDGPAPALIDLGDLFALADASRALYPYLPQSHATIGGEPIGRTPAFADTLPTEADVDALLRDDAVFPRGMWDMMPDGIGAPTVLPPVYDIRPAAPYGVAGEFPALIDAMNAHATLGLDPTTLLTPPGRVFLDRIALGIGTEIVNEFELTFADVGAAPPVGGFPFLETVWTGESLAQRSPLGLRLDEDVLLDLATDLSDLREPAPPAGGDPFALERGEIVYDLVCASCHGPLRGLNPHSMVSLAELRAAYSPTTLLQRGFPFSDVLDDRLTTFDDRLVLFDQLYSAVQVPSQNRSIAAPHLKGLHLRSMFLHDGSIETLDELLDPARGPGAPHAFFVLEPARSDLIEYLTRR